MAILSSHHAFALSDSFWDRPMFQKDQWEGIMKFIRLALALGGGLFLIYEARARKLGEPLRPRTRRRLLYLLTGIAFLAYFDFFNPNTRMFFGDAKASIQALVAEFKGAAS